MKGLIIYKGKYGATRQYAEWLQEDLGLDVYPAEDCPAPVIGASDLVLIGSSVYFGKLLIRDWLKKQLLQIKDKRIFLFVVCGTPLDETEKLNSILQLSVPEEIRNRCDAFFLPGKMIRKELSWWDRFVTGMVDRMSKAKDSRESIPADYDRVERPALNEMFLALRNLLAEEEREEEMVNSR